MATGTPGHFSGGVDGGGKDKGRYDMATQTFRKGPKKAKGKPGVKPPFPPMPMK